jgi:hypothetical protein
VFPCFTNAHFAEAVVQEVAAKHPAGAPEAGYPLPEALIAM